MAVSSSPPSPCIGPGSPGIDGHLSIRFPDRPFFRPFGNGEREKGAVSSASETTDFDEGMGDAERALKRFGRGRG
jgi:hypothetical protein